MYTPASTTRLPMTKLGEIRSPKAMAAMTTVTSGMRSVAYDTADAVQSCNVNRKRANITTEPNSTR